MKLTLKRSQVLFHWCWRQTCNKLDRNFTHQRSKISWKTFLCVWMTRGKRGVTVCLKQSQKKLFQCSWNGLFVSEIFAVLQLIAPLFFGFAMCSSSNVPQVVCCASCSDLVSLGEDPKITKAFIYLFVTVCLPALSSMLLLCFPNWQTYYG